MSAHTPGPWHLLEDGTDIMVIGKGSPLASIPIGWPTDRANAHLIAVAPELLVLCESAVDLIRGELIGVEWKQACADFLCSADAVITKATSQQ